jgi:hypothetical protein
VTRHPLSAGVSRVRRFRTPEVVILKTYGAVAARADHSSVTSGRWTQTKRLLSWFRRSAPSLFWNIKRTSSGPRHVVHVFFCVECSLQSHPVQGALFWKGISPAQGVQVPSSAALGIAGHMRSPGPRCSSRRTAS